MGKGKTKDRTARLLKIEHLLYQVREGLTVVETARLCGVSKRTTYRDLRALESVLGIPIWEEGSKRGIVEGHFLPPIRFSISEALNIFLAIRLMLGYSHRYDPNTASTFVKLNSVVPAPLRDQVQRTLDWMQKLPLDEKRLRIMTKLAEAWVTQHRARITYRSLEAERASERLIEPYFIEPAAEAHASYVIAYCHRSREIRVFKIERIEDIQVTSEPYSVPQDFDANAYLGSAWGIVVEGDVKTVRLRFASDLARLMEETVWHPSQVLEKQADGSLIMTLRVFDTWELYSWILRWGEKVEVLEPPELRKAVVETAEAMVKIYQKKQKF